ncbi:DUF6932 family protein [Roseinatronobacter bogoriensis]|uniref:Uncharacterized protein n=1 Tax=Roseinatronobacter bogoriensis subsp. barguzinensis TaxID=441209 RepID=A0A2K8KAX4_9RHOB|nr:hypothetical protein [Rhodobaca]ATX65053.1 hypothetical protein BG454_03750 [Rhodobaca barguzinensis]MBB4208894.1 hypothetical protein [Rhodobaca bogoriensis DSM 18756]
MPIPDFAANGALPPFISGDPTIPNARSPFQATMHEVVNRFCTSRERAKLLKGLNEYRKHLHSGGFVSGSQWIDGSFVENVELLRKRSPSDIDVVTLFNRPLKYQTQPKSWEPDYTNHIHRTFFDTVNMKPTYYCDTYAVDLDAGSRSLVRNTTYWFGLFSDMRGSSSKKGILEIPLSVDPMEFAAINQAIGAKFNV